MEPSITTELRRRKAAEVSGEAKKKCEMNELSRGRIQSATRRILVVSTENARVDEHTGETYDPLREMTRHFRVSQDPRAIRTNNVGRARASTSTAGCAGLLPLSLRCIQVAAKLNSCTPWHAASPTPASDILSTLVYILRRELERVAANDDREEKFLVNFCPGAVERAAEKPCST